jgi:hypothetical protein
MKNLLVTPTAAGYELTSVTTDLVEHVVATYIVQLLSEFVELTQRGSLLQTEIARFSVKTADSLVNLFALGSLDVILTMRRLELGLRLANATLEAWRIEDDTRLRLTCLLAISENPTRIEVLLQ